MRRSPISNRALAWAALTIILIHGALLRLDAITGRYGPVTSPDWLAGLRTRSIAPPAAIRPASVVWDLEPMFPHRDGTVARYRSDPHTYLDTARRMTWFYAGHQREPVFPYVTKWFLRLLSWEDVAVSFASTLFSLLAVWFTYLLGASFWSRPVGLIAALLLSIDMDVVSLASLGWRDDAYMAMTVLCGWLALRWWRAGPPGTRERAIGRWRVDATYLAAAAAGVAGGLAILTRITAVTFLLPPVVWLFVERRAGWRRQLAAVGVAWVVALLVAAPFFVNVWRMFGDPFYSFNVHGSVYSLAEGQAEYTGGTVGYISAKFAKRPLLMFDTVAQGLTTYPFFNKWNGLYPWMASLPLWASMFSVAGLLVLAASSAGRLLLVVALGSVVPFAFTWTVDPDYRFTVQAYPFLLVAAGVAAGAVTRVVVKVITRTGAGVTPEWWREPWRPWVATAAAGVLVIWLVYRVLPSRVFAETLRAGEDATLTAGVRDATFFGPGWSSVIRGSNVSARSTLSDGVLSIRLPEPGDYPAMLRIDPYPRPAAASSTELPIVDVLLNDAPVTTLQLEWSPDRVGTYRFVLPHAAVRRGTNQITLRVRPSVSGGLSGISLWYLRVHPRQ